MKYCIFVFLLVPYTVCSIQNPNRGFDYKAFFNKVNISAQTTERYLQLLKQAKNGQEVVVKNKTEELNAAIKLDLDRLKWNQFSEKTEKWVAFGGSICLSLFVVMVGWAAGLSFFNKKIFEGVLLTAGTAGCGSSSYFAYKYSTITRVLQKKEQKIKEREKIMQVCAGK
jgi:hypothetical protein